MNNENNHIDYSALISKYLANEASESEIKMLEEWVLMDNTNKKLFNDYKQAWIVSNINKPNNAIDLNSEWDKIENKLFATKTINNQKKENTRRGFYQYNKIAASIIVILSLGYLLSLFVIKSDTKNLVANNSTETATLIDGTIVTLNQNSSLTYFKEIASKRKVKLEGDAFFNVKRDTLHPFIIETQNTEIEVLGTSFYVNSHNDKPTIEVTVKTGKVAFRITQDNQIVLVAGEKGIYTKSTGSLQHSVNKDVNFIAWKTKYLKFNDTKLSDVVDKINSVYHSNILINNKELNNCRVTVIFKNQTLETVLNVLEETLDLNFKKDKEQIILIGNGC